MFTQKRMWFNLLRVAVLILIAIAFIYIFRNIRISDFLDDFSHFDFIWIIPALAVYLFGYVIRGYRWVVLLAPIKKCSFKSLFPTLVIGFMANNVTPFRLGEFIRAHLNGKKEKISRSASLGTIILERLFDGMAMLLILGASIYFRHQPTSSMSQSIDESARKASFIFGLAFVVFFLMILFKNFTVGVINYLISHFPRKHHAVLQKIAHTFLDGLQILQNARETFLVLLTSLAAWTCEFTAFYLIGMGFHLAPDPLHYNSAALLMAIVNLGLMVPFSPGGLGVFEGIGISLLSIYAIPSHTALAYILTVHLVVFLPITLWGFYFLHHEGLSLKSIEKEQKAKARR